MTHEERPIQERIAELFGRSSYFDPREGAGGTCPARIRHSDVAAALGHVSRECGRPAALVLETQYGSTLTHERALSRAWESHDAPDRRDQAAVVLSRFAGALAIRMLAGSRYSTSHYAEYAYLLFSRRETVQRRVAEASAWLQGQHDTGLPVFRETLRERLRERVY